MPDPYGRPVLTMPAQAARHPELSLSHSGEYAAALVCTMGSCGIDIQMESARLLTVQERFATEAECALLDAVPEKITRLAILWAAKEAVKKCFFPDQPTLFGNTRVTEVRRQTESGWQVNCRLQETAQSVAVVHVARFDRYVLAGVTGAPHA